MVTFHPDEERSCRCDVADQGDSGHPTGPVVTAPCPNPFRIMVPVNIVHELE